MDEIREKKQEIRTRMIAALSAIPKEEYIKRVQGIESRLFEFANFLEAKIVLFYIESPGEVMTANIIRRSYRYNKIIILPYFEGNRSEIGLYKVDSPRDELRTGQRGIPEPVPEVCRKVPMDCIDIAIIPGIALDEKGGRIGSGNGYYDKLIPKLPLTTRKVSLAFDFQILPQVPMESHDKHVDIIITEKRVIYKI